MDVETEAAYEGPAVHTVLPAELLTSVFRLLPPQSLYACMRTCRFMKDLIYARRKRLQKNSLTLTIERKSEWTLSLKISKTSMSSPRKEWLCHIKKIDPNCPQTTTESAAQERMSVAEFYDSHGLSGLKWNSANKSQTFCTDDVEGLLKEFVEFLMMRSHLKALFVVNLTNSEVRLLTNLIKYNFCSIEHIQLDSKSQTGLDEKLLIDAANTDTVCLGFIEPTHFSPLIFDSPAMKKASTVILTVDNRQFGPRAIRPYEYFEITDQMFLNLQADTFQTSGAFTKITENGLRTFLVEWYAGERNINGIEILFPHVPFVYLKLVEGFQFVIKVKPGDPPEKGYILIKRPAGEMVKLMRHSNDVLDITEAMGESFEADFVPQEDDINIESSDSEEDEEEIEQHQLIWDGEARMLRNIVRDFDHV